MRPVLVRADGDDDIDPLIGQAIEVGHAAVHARFAHGDLASILDHHATTGASSPMNQAGEYGSLTQGTSGWAALRTPAIEEPRDDAAEAAV